MTSTKNPNPLLGDDTIELPRGGKKRTTRKDSEVFCYCREPEGNRFMIGCDKCDEWYHGECIEITRAKGKEIDTYYCPSCVSKDPELKIVYFPKKSYAEGEEPPQRCSQCINCIRAPDCGECDRCVAKDGRCVHIECLSTTVPPTAEKKKDKPPRKPARRKQSDDEFEEEVVSPLPSSSSRKAAGGGVAMSDKKLRGRKKGWRKDKADKSPVKTRTKEQPQPTRPGYDTTLEQRLDNSSQMYAGWQEQKGRGKKGRATKPEKMQCLGVGCKFETRPESKYCSDACGMSLAKARLLTHLPKGIDNFWRVEPVAVTQARQEEARMKEEMETLTEEKKSLDKWCTLILNYLQSIKVLRPDETEDDKKEDGELMIACPVCAVESKSKEMLKHIKNCYIKAEKQTTFGTSHKYPVNPDNMFCEEFNKSNNSYCKRLRVICPEHYKGDIEEGLEICGHPKAWCRAGSFTMDHLYSTEDITSQGICSISRKRCDQHSSWIHTTLGLIDARRVAILYRLEELFESRKAVTGAKRGDALVLMCNSTEYHQPLKQIIDKYDEEAKKTETVMSVVL